MKYISTEDIGRFSRAVTKVIEQLGSGIKRIELEKEKKRLYRNN